MAKSFSHPRILPQRGGLRLSDQQRKAATIWYNWYAGGGGAQEHEGLKYAKQNGFVLDLTNMSLRPGAEITSDEESVKDLGINGYNTTPQNNPVAMPWVDATTGKIAQALQDVGNQSLETPLAFHTLFKGDFHLIVTIQVGDGVISEDRHFLGVLETNTTDNRQKIIFWLSSADSTLRFNLGAGNQFAWISSSALLADGPSGIITLHVKFNKSENEFTVTKKIDGGAETEVTGNVTVSGDNVALSNFDNSDFSLETYPIYLGALNNAGTISSNTSSVRLFKYVVIPSIMTDEDAANVIDWAHDIYEHTDWSHEFGVTNAATSRTSLRGTIFPGGYPSNDTPAASEAVTEGTIHGIDVDDIDNKTSVTRLQFNRDDIDGDEWRHFCYHIVSSATAKGECAFVCRGHSDADDVIAINRFLELGYDVIWCCQPTTGDNEDTTDNETDSDVPTNTQNNHNDFLTGGLDRLGYLPFDLFFFDKIECLNYLAANFSYSKYHVYGLSGGGWTACWLGALDTRFATTNISRGVKLISQRYSGEYVGAKANPQVNHVPDYEQGPANNINTACGPRVAQLYLNNSFGDLITLCGYPSRKVTFGTHIADSSLFYGESYNQWKTIAQQKVASIGGTFTLVVHTTEGNEAHKNYLEEVNSFISNL